MWQNLLIIAVGATGGAWARWWASSYSYGTLSVNIIGSLLIGLLLGAPPLTEQQRLALATGFLGSFTTFSTFSAETLTLLLREEYSSALLYLFLSLSGSLLACAIGFALARTISVNFP